MRTGAVRIAFTAVVLVLVVVVQQTWTSPAGAQPQRVPASEIAHEDADFEVFMAVDATAAQIAGVEARLDGERKVRRYAHLSKDDAYAEFERIFRNDPDIVRSVTAADLPESFRVDLVPGAKAKPLLPEFAALAGVDSVPPRTTLTVAEALSHIRECQARATDLEVFLRVDATDAQLAAAVAVVKGEPGLTITRVLSKADAYVEFRREFANNKKLVDSVTAADLPVSIRIAASGPVSDETMQRLWAIDGVDNVSNPRAACQSVDELLARGLTPRQLARLIVTYALGGPLA